MKNWLKYMLILIAGVLGGLFLSHLNVNKKIRKAYKDAQANEQRLEEKIDSLWAIFNKAGVKNDSLLVLRHRDSVERALERLKTIPLKRTLEDEKYILETGKQLYGSSSRTNSKRALIASYSGHAFDEVFIDRRIIENQKAQISACKGVVIYKDSIVIKYKEGLKYAAKKAKKGQLGKGIGLGVIGTVIIGLLVL